MSARLIAVAHGRVVGEVRSDLTGRLRFAYDDEWVNTGNAFPLSLSIPFAKPAHGHRTMQPWMEGLLPKSATQSGRPNGRNGTDKRREGSARNVFTMLATHGLDCAGAVQWVRPERLSSVVGPGHRDMRWLTELEVEERLVGLGPDIRSWRRPDDKGRFTLSGARPKTALFADQDRWGVPSGRIPTTHILKPPITRLPGHCENEHLCQTLARAMDIPAAWTRLVRFGKSISLVVARYDRRRPTDPLALDREPKRIHQESLPQALGMGFGGEENGARLGCKDLARVIRTHSERPGQDLRAFARVMILNWIIGASTTPRDLSLLIGPGGRAALAPVHGLTCRLVYPGRHAHRLELSIPIGGESRMAYVRAGHWRRFASETGLSPTETVKMCEAMAEAVPDRFHSVLRAAWAAGLTHPIGLRIREEIISRARTCLTILRRGRQGARSRV